MRLKSVLMAFMFSGLMLLSACTPKGNTPSNEPNASSNVAISGESTIENSEEDVPSVIKLEPLGESYNDFWPEYATPVQEEDGVYKVSTAEELAWCAVQSNESYELDGFKDKTIQLQNDIDLSGHNWVPFGEDGKGLNGVLDGNGYSIKYMTMATYTKEPGEKAYSVFDDSANSATEEQVYRSFGLIATLGKGGTVQNLTVDGSWANGLFRSVGGIVAYNKGGYIYNCINKSDLNTTYLAGGICASAVYTPESGGIEKCSNYGDIRGNEGESGILVGGIVAQYTMTDPETYCIVRECSNYGSVEGAGQAPKVGGMIGYLENIWFDSNHIFIESCVNRGEIRAVGEKFAAASGLVYSYSLGGEDTSVPYGSFVDCLNMGSVYAEAEVCYASGIIQEGQIEESTYSLKYCGNTGNITANGAESYAGGIMAQGIIIESFPAESCYNAGEISAELAGAIVGSGNISGNLYFVNTLPISGAIPEGMVAGGKAYSKEDMQAESFVATLGGNWVMDNGQNKGFPILAFME